MGLVQLEHYSAESTAGACRVAGRHKLADGLFARVRRAGCCQSFGPGPDIGSSNAVYKKLRRSSGNTSLDTVAVNLPNHRFVPQ